jgi:hypothetical protein
MPISSFCYLVSPNVEGFTSIGIKGWDHRHVRSVATSCNQHSANTRRIVAGIKCMPATIQIGLEPCCKVTGWEWRLGSNVAKITSAVACRYI